MNEVVRTATQRGIALLDLGRAGEAERHLREALAAEPDNPTVLALLADALLRQEKFTQAMDTGRSALRADPENVAAFSVLAAALGGLKRYQDALDTVRRGLALAPEVAGLHLQEAGVLLAQDRYEDALASIERATRLAPESSRAAAMRAAALFKLRRLDEADTAVAEALRLDPENADAHHLRGVLALHRGDKPAIQSHRTAVRLDPTEEHHRDGLSLALKTRNPLYRWLLRFAMWLDTVPKGVRLLVLVTPFVLTRVLRPVEDQLWAKILIIVVTALVLLSWTLEPLMNFVLLLSRDRNLLTRPAKQATYAFFTFLAAGVACAVYSQTAGPAQLLAVALGFGFWAMATGSAHLLEPDRRKVVWYGTAAAAVFGTMAIVAVLVTAPAATVAVAIVLLSGIAAMWFTAFAN